MASQLNKARHTLKEFILAGHQWAAALERVAAGYKLTAEEREKLMKECTDGKQETVGG